MPDPNEAMLTALAAGLDLLQTRTTEIVDRSLRRAVTDTLGAETEQKIYDSAVRMVNQVQVLDSARVLSPGQIRNYLEHLGIHCPDCLSHDIEGQAVEISDGHASQEVSCNACGLSWVDDYEISCVRNVKFPEPRKEGTLEKT